MRSTVEEVTHHDPRSHVLLDPGDDPTLAATLPVAQLPRECLVLASAFVVNHRLKVSAMASACNFARSIRVPHGTRLLRLNRCHSPAFERFCRRRFSGRWAADGVSSTPRTGPFFCVAANSSFVPIPALSIGSKVRVRNPYREQGPTQLGTMAGVEVYWVRTVSPVGRAA
jgi:hypothetical protein